MQPNVCGLIVTTDKECAFTHTYKTTNTFMVFDKGYVIGKQYNILYEQKQNNKHGHKHGHKAPNAVHTIYTTFYM